MVELALDHMNIVGEERDREAQFIVRAVAKVIEGFRSCVRAYGLSNGFVLSKIVQEDIMSERVAFSPARHVRPDRSSIGCLPRNGIGYEFLASTAAGRIDTRRSERPGQPVALYRPLNRETPAPLIAPAYYLHTRHQSHQDAECHGTQRTTVRASNPQEWRDQHSTT